MGSNYRRVCHAQSDRDFIAKLKVVEEETDESCFWLDVCLELGFGDEREASRLNGESGELKAMVVSSIQTKRSRLRVPMNLRRASKFAVRSLRAAVLGASAIVIREASRLNGESGELKATVVSSIQTKRSRLHVR